MQDRRTPHARVRARTDADLDVCVSLAELVHERDGYPTYLTGGLWDFLMSDDAIAVWVAQRDDAEIVGHVSLHRRTLPAVMALACGTLDRSADRLAVIARLLVAPSARREGVGAALVEAAATGAHDRGCGPYSM